ncbi:hypothetical protein CYMTET_9997 [Cymbomonas tetramitiformis]|uniref:Uncharacterized protein n=1 Tax=Cymbomonas tetramitiformis TaxID=36881 RepID=A0AAE0LEG3_9CHLO|nr:hypothetical protein CYMTET_9997 [Cymbomonas tetramitiformis]
MFHIQGPRKTAPFLRRISLHSKTGLEKRSSFVLPGIHLGSFLLTWTSFSKVSQDDRLYNKTNCYIGVKQKVLVVPFMDDYKIYRTGLKRAQVAFLVYGGLSGAIATLEGKPW